MSRILFGLYDDESLWLACALDEGELWPPLELRSFSMLFGPTLIVGGPALSLRLMRFGRRFEPDMGSDGKPIRHRAALVMAEEELWLLRRTLLRANWQVGKTAKGYPLNDLLQRIDSAILPEHEKDERDAISDADEDRYPDEDTPAGAASPLRPGENP